MKPAIIGVHLDLKYLMPRKSYLLEWLARLPAFGINAILVEYEDKFPFAKYPFLREADAFTPDELRAFLAAARRAGLQPIPLVQSFSHLEFALAHEELAHLREAPEIHTQICPCKPEAVAFVLDLVREVMAFHEEEDCVHLGGDETWFLGTCPACQKRLARCGSKEAFWVEHQREIMRPVQEAGKRPIYWDDIFWTNPDAIRELDLPKDVILHCWNYNITNLKAKEAKGDLELGGGKQQLRQVDVYREAGYDTLAAPCFNWGILYPQHAHCLKNTAVWAEKMRASGMLGMLNTAWACFYVPLGATWLHTAATGALSAGQTADRAWEDAFLADEYGVAVEGLPEALETLGAMWEVRVEGVGRPLNPVLYGYMEMVLHYRGGQPERQRRGATPLDWNEIDFVEMYRRKIDYLRTHPERAAIDQKLEEFIEAYSEAAEVLHALADAATRHVQEARLLGLFGDMKLAHARACRFLLGRDEDGEDLAAEFAAEGDRIRDALAFCMEPAGIERMVRVWWEPTARALAAVRTKAD